MYYVYLLQSDLNNSFYLGSTKDLKRRFAEHNKGASIYTKKYLPWKLIYYEAFLTYALAYDRELALKRRSKSFQELVKRLGLER